MLTLDVDGVNQEYPEDNEPEFTWGAVSSACISAMVDAITARVRLTTDQSVAGNKTFTDSVIVTILKSVTASPATSGLIRLAKTDTIQWRNNGGGGNLPLGISSGDLLQFNSIDLVDKSTAQTLSNKNHLILTTSTAGTTLTSASPEEHYVVPANDSTYKLDNSFTAGSKRLIFNDSATKKITVTANDNSTISVLIPKSWAIFMCPSSTPTTNTSWKQIDAGGGWVDAGTVAGDFSAGFGTVTLITSNMRRTESELEWVSCFKMGTVAASSGTINLPFGLNISSTSVLATGLQQFGIWFRLDASTLTLLSDGNVSGVCFYQGNAGSVTFTSQVGSGKFKAANVSDFGASDTVFQMQLKIPISGWEIG